MPAAADAECRSTAEGRRAKFYRITPAGQKQLTAERKNWDRIVFAIGQVLSEP